MLASYREGSALSTSKEFRAVLSTGGGVGSQGVAMWAWWEALLRAGSGGGLLRAHLLTTDRALSGPPLRSVGPVVRREHGGLEGLLPQPRCSLGPLALRPLAGPGLQTALCRGSRPGQARSLGQVSL